MEQQPTSPWVAVIGAGPAGLKAAEHLSASGVPVVLYDRMPSFGRKFLMAGVGGMNITHSEPLPQFIERYREAAPWVAHWLAALPPSTLQPWMQSLGIDSFVGSSGRVFPQQMKAAPLLRAWLQQLRRQGVRTQVRHRWSGWDAEGALRFETPTGALQCRPSATVLALGAASWPQLGADGSWVPWLQQRGVTLAPWQPANCGFRVPWSAGFRDQHAGAPLKHVAALWQDYAGQPQRRLGEAVISADGIEGSLVYAASADLRRQLPGTLTLDLLPHLTREQLVEKLAAPRGKRSWSTHLRKVLQGDAVKAALLRELTPPSTDPLTVATALKALPVPLQQPAPLEQAISCAGGVPRAALTPQLMLSACPGVFCAGEMLDWEAPTGGYLLSACLASGAVAAAGVLAWLADHGR